MLQHKRSSSKLEGLFRVRLLIRRVALGMWRISLGWSLWAKVEMEGGMVLNDKLMVHALLLSLFRMFGIVFKQY